MFLHIAPFRIVLLTLGLSTLLTACSHHIATEHAEQWRIEYKITGGIDGRIQGLDIAHDGHYRIYDKKRRLERAQFASPEQLAIISEQVALIANDSRSQQARKLPHRPCADCITRQVQIDYKNRKFSHKSRTGMPQDPAYSVLLKTLTEMLIHGLAREAD